MKINEGKASCMKPTVFVYMRNVRNSNRTRALGSGRPRPRQICCRPRVWIWVTSNI